MIVGELPHRLLLGPGPSPVAPRVLAALAQPPVGHLDPLFLALMDEVRDRLRTVFGTQNEMTLAMSGTGSAGMETVIVNLVEPGDRVLVAVNGVFGGRLAEVARRTGGRVVAVHEHHVYGPRPATPGVLTSLHVPVHARAAVLCRACHHAAGGRGRRAPR